MSERDASVNIREATPDDAESIARVHIESSRATYSGIVPDRAQDAMTYEKRLDNWSKTLEGGDEFVYVAETKDGEVVGFASGGPRREGDDVYDGELYTVYLLPEHGRRGTGRRLMLAVVETLQSLGLRALMLWVLDANPACRFYEALGGVRVREEEIERGGRALKKVAYAWTDLSALAEKLRA
ncbi:MAG: GNAT family N-acetyltransferase [Rubrivivax sp.]|nr:GNAT family N-acetyltransferase [Pyrinomonadaceae bacterium]